ncbi:hypothetical protein [Streptomyces sp. Isolate_219]|uniref:hypothetical protein n=1 Tax=Streptomyces sp. Isolate_219 TaxID=2950110 RepID=UPI0021C5C9FC|nr:hypothetical protein [Streptomyces sp. Isolate_219]MCR8573559.1 hypothetical protein [Streptomyces sp. Isolate_219]
MSSCVHSTTGTTPTDSWRHAPAERASVAAIARRAGVDRTFLYRHRDLLGQIHVQAAEPPTVPGGRGPAVSRASLQADLVAADARTARLAAQVRRLEARLSQVLGEQVWRESGIGGPDDAEQLQTRISALEQQVIDLELKIQDRDDDLAAARAANRELMTQLNRGWDVPPSEQTNSSPTS